MSPSDPKVPRSTLPTLLTLNDPIDPPRPSNRYAPPRVLSSSVVVSCQSPPTLIRKLGLSGKSVSRFPDNPNFLISIAPPLRGNLRLGHTWLRVGGWVARWTAGTREAHTAQRRGVSGDQTAFRRRRARPAMPRRISRPLVGSGIAPTIIGPPSKSIAELRILNVPSLSTTYSAQP